LAPRLEEISWPQPQLVSSGGTAAEFHGRPLPQTRRPQIWIHTSSSPALVLGSTQNASLIDVPKAQAAGYEVSKRHSGGGLVAIDPQRSVWVDVIIPPGHPRWANDIGRAFMWVGQAWARALSRVGVDDPVVHSGPTTDPKLGRVLCFGSTGPGEVTSAGSKVVGLSQRRTRHGARFQGIAHQKWSPSVLEGLLLAENLDDLGAKFEALSIGADFDRRLLTNAVVESLQASLRASAED
jgi:lipoate-protein ligase A